MIGKRFNYHSTNTHERVQNQVTMSGIASMIVINSLESLHGALRNEETHAVKQASWWWVGHVIDIASTLLRHNRYLNPETTHQPARSRFAGKFSAETKSVCPSAITVCRQGVGKLEMQ